MPEPIGAETRLETLFAEDPAAVARLALIHPAFDPAVGRELGVPPDASLADMARATDLPLDVILAAAWGEIRVPELCACHNKKAAKAAAGGCGGGAH